MASDGKLWQYAMTNLGSPTAVEAGMPPSGTALTGEVGALHDYVGGGEYVDVAAVDTSGNLSDYYSGVGGGTWSRMALGNPGTPIDTYADVAATRDEAGGMVIFVVRLTNGHLAANINFSWRDLGTPPFGTTGALAATMARIGGIQKLLVVTPAASSRSTLYVCELNGSTCTWIARSTPGYAELRAANHSVAITKQGGTSSDDIVHLAAFGWANKHVYRLMRNGASGWGNIEDLGVAFEQTDAGGGVTLVAENFEPPKVYFIGSVGQYADYLFSRGTYAYAQPWYNYGAGSPVHQDTNTDRPHSEVSLAEYKGRLLSASIVRQNPFYVEATYSSTDGYYWTAPVSAQKSIGGVTYNYGSDPTVGFDASGTGWLSMLAMKSRNSSCQSTSFDHQAIYFMSTTNGTSFSTPIVVDHVTIAPNNVTPLDHPYMVVDRTTSEKHIAWLDQRSPQSVIYQRYSANNQAGSRYVLSTGADPASAGFPTLAIGAGSRIYAAWVANPNSAEILHGLSVCEVGPAGRLYTPVNLCAYGGASTCMDGSDLPVDSQYIRVLEGWSLAASQRTPGRLFLAYHTRRPGGTDKELRFVTSADGGRTWTAPVPVHANDSADEFNPAVTVTQNDVVFVSWYDRRDSYNGRWNYYIRPRRAVSYDGGLTFSNETDVLPSRLPTDPALLPHHCSDPTRRLFIGDYHESLGEDLHTHATVSDVPAGSPAERAYLWDTFIAPRAQ